MKKELLSKKVLQNRCTKIDKKVSNSKKVTILK